MPSGAPDNIFSSVVDPNANEPSPPTPPNTHLMTAQAAAPLIAREYG